MIRFIVRYICFPVATLSCGMARGQDFFSFSHVGIEQGLSQSCVTSMYQDEFNMVWIGTQDGLNRYDGSRMRIYRPVAGDPQTLFSNNIKTVCGNRNGKIYVLCKYALCEMDMPTERFRTIRDNGIQAIAQTRETLWAATDTDIFRLDADSLAYYYSLSERARVTCLYESSSGFLWVGTASSGVKVVDRNRKETTLLPNRHVINIYEDSKHNIWIATRQDGLYRIDKSGNEANYRHDERDAGSLSDNYVRTVCEDDQGNFWIGTMKGVNVFDPQTRVFLHADHSNRTPHSLAYSSTWCIIKDHQGTMWIGSYFSGASIYNRANDFYTPHNRLFDNPRLSVVSAMTDDGNGNLWIGTEGAGLVKYNPRSAEITEPGGKKLASSIIKSLYLDKETDALWIGTLLGGLKRLDVRTGEVRVFTSGNNGRAPIPNNNIRKILPYGDGRLLLATHRGIAVFDTRTHVSTLLCEQSAGHYISDMMLDREGNCWFAVSEGVVRYNPRDQTTKTYFTEENSPLGSNHILVFFSDRDGRIWLGSSGGGVFRHDPDTDDFFQIDHANSGLINDYILDIDESEAGYLLLATNSGLVRYDPDSHIFYNYDTQSGFPVSNILPYGLYVDSSHEIYVFGYKSLISFNEKNLADVQWPMDVYFTSLSVNGKPVGVGDETRILDNSLLYQKKIDLRSRHSTIAVDYATSSFVPYENVRIEYRMTGFGEEWIPAAKGQPIVFTNLEPRTYLLEIRVIDSHSGSIMAGNTLSVTMHPPIYKTIWAIILLVLSVAAITLWLIRFYISKLKLRASLELEKREKSQVQEMTQSKIRFFTYVSHEVRTPVTLIQNQCEAIMQKVSLSPSLYGRMTSIQNNLHKITRLINELIDFQKQGQDFPQMSFTRTDLVSLLEKIRLTFREYARDKEIDLIFEHQDDRVEVWCDAEQLEKVFYNLISNAFKFTGAQEEIVIRLRTSGDNAVVKVSDTGAGIDPRYQEHIFDAFYQAPCSGDKVMGSGLGLTITRSIVHAHYGTIALESEPGTGSVFTVMLPLGRVHIPSELIRIEKNEDEQCIDEMGCVDDEFIDEVVRTRTASDMGIPSILIVEDHDELREHLTALFSPLYRVIEASDGVDALNKLSAAVPDIILSDLMMPNMDGNELCRKVKDNFATSHIPFVILTAKVAVESALEGFRYGADDYIAKPFNSRILITKCNNLVNTRAHMQHKFARSTSVKSSILAVNKADQQLVERAAEVVIGNISNPEFDIIQFSREMALGRTKLFSKLKGVTGQTPSQFIMNIRLKHSVWLLEHHPELSVSEIGFMAGFNSPSYFIKSFRTLYGLTPVAYREKRSG